MFTSAQWAMLVFALAANVQFLFLLWINSCLLDKVRLLEDTVSRSQQGLPCERITNRALAVSPGAMRICNPYVSPLGEKLCRASLPPSSGS